MNMPTFDAPSYSGYRFPAGIISHCTWLYFRFALSYRDVEEMMAERGVTVSYESVREWCLKFGGTYTKQIRSRRGRLGDRWHLDEVFLRINGKLHYLWRAVDQDGKVLDILVQSRRHKQAAKKFFRKLLKGSSVRSTDHRHQQTPQLRGSQGRGHAFHRSSSAERTQQPGGEFSPAYPRTRTPHGRVQISRTGAEIPLDLRGNRVVFPSRPTFTDSSGLPRDHAPPLHTMA
jgi:hypothetical protein